MDVVDRVASLVAPLLQDEGLELFDVEWGGGRLVVFAETPTPAPAPAATPPAPASAPERPPGVDLAALTRATHRISAELDRVDPVPGRYLLEVSSPGLERRLRTPEHYKRFVGATVNVKTVPTADGDRRTKGTLQAADDDGITVDGRRISYADIDRAQTVFEWGPAHTPKARNKK